MLTELRELHEEILSNLAALDILTRHDTPPMDRLPAVRLALTKASRARTLLLERLYPKLGEHVAAAQRAAFDDLKMSGKDNMVASAKHIGSWSLREIEGRWPQYCAASNAMRAAMRERVALEAKLLYPLVD